MSHLLLTNDYPPKIGGIQSYLWELWRRLPASEFEVFTSPHDGHDAFDNAQSYRVHRYDRFWLPPTPRVQARAAAIARDMNADAVVIDPAFPLGSLGSRLGLPYAVVLHGAEVSVPSNVPGIRRELARVIADSSLVISASRFAETEARNIVADDFPPTVWVPPGVDTRRFVPLNQEQRQAARRRFGFHPTAPLVLGLSRLVPRKGFDVLIQAAARAAVTHPGLQLVIAGTGRDEARLRRLLAQHKAPAHLIGFVPDDDLPDLYGCADLFAMLCRDRWGGLEQEGFGIVFVEAAAAGCPQIAGASGGSADAVDDGMTGMVIADPTDVGVVTDAINSALAQPERLAQMRVHSRDHAVQNFDYDLLTARLSQALATIGAVAG